MKSRSEAAKEYQKWYKSKGWRRIRERQLYKHPMCQCPHCNEHGLVADTVDHIKAHKGDRNLFFDTTNVQSMNKECHDRYKQSQERGGAGFDKGCNERGWPLNQEHEWYTR